MDNAKQKTRLCPADGSQCNKACPNYKASRNCNLYSLFEQNPDSLPQVLEAGKISSRQNQDRLSPLPHISLKIHADGWAREKIKAIKSKAADNSHTFDAAEEFLIQNQFDDCEDAVPLLNEQLQPKTSFDRIRESGSRLFGSLAAIVGVIIILLLIFGSFAS